MSNKAKSDLLAAVDVRPLAHGEQIVPIALYPRYADSVMAGFMRDLVLKLIDNSAAPFKVVGLAEAIVAETYETMLRRGWVSEIPPMNIATHQHVHE